MSSALVKDRLLLDGHDLVERCFGYARKIAPKLFERVQHRHILGTTARSPELGRMKGLDAQQPVPTESM